VPDAGVPWHRAFEDLPGEHGFAPLELEGSLPAGLRGTLVRCGPALFAPFGRRCAHWFDGDGAVTAVRIADGRAQGAVRVVATPGLARERARGRRIYPVYGGRAAGLVAHLSAVVAGRPKNAANTSVLAWQERLFALQEAVLPTELDPTAFATRGETDFDGVVPRSFSAHPHRVAARRSRYNFGVRYGVRTQLDLFELPDAGAPRRLASLPLPDAPMIHDFCATERHLVLFAPPLQLGLVPFVLGLSSYADSLRWRPERGTEVIVVPIENPARPIRFRADPFFQWHFVNAYEQGDEIVLDFVRYPDFAVNAWLVEIFGRREPTVEAHGRLVRAVISTRGERIRFEPVAEATCEFPRVAPSVEGARHRVAWVAAHSHGQGPRPSPQDRLARIDCDTGETTVTDLGPATFPGEPVYAPREGSSAEDHGWVLSLGYDGTSHRSFVAVLEAGAFSAGPRARLWFPHHIPPPLHGQWIPG
jgi:all-trans-8'-apo-beta-carotenal 15,15'-oxygenase